MSNLLSAIALTMLALGAGLTFVRLVRGPSLPDRVISIDLVGILIVCVLVVVAGDSGQQAFLDVAMVIALTSFVGTVAYARYLERERPCPGTCRRAVAAVHHPQTSRTGIHRAGRDRSAAAACFDLAGRRDFACRYSRKAIALLCSVSRELYTSVTVPRRAADTIGFHASGHESSSRK